MQINKFFIKLFIFSFGFSLFSCQPQIADNTNNNPNIISETDLCTTNSTYSQSTTITGTATFSKRGLDVQKSGNQLTRLTLSGPISVNLPIRYAEIRVLNSSGNVIQCGQTNSTGQLKALDGVSNLIIPATAGTYTIEVLSRANHTMAVPSGKTPFLAFFSVKEDIYSNTLYKISSTISTTGTGTYSTDLNSTGLNATALESVSNKIEGGAFNIYNDIITAYDYLANATGTQDLSCLNPKLSAYWKAGFNPNQYIYPDADPSSLGTISYYLRGDKELYINGGILGNVSTVDTDHFDDSVIIHELGHHVENSCGTMDSPGGSHNGSARIDERLAWSEGWGNFFGANVIKNKLSDINPDLPSLLPNGEWLYYFDSEGYTDGATSSGFEYIKINLARLGSGTNSTREILYSSSGTGSYDFDPVDPTLNPGEGHTREVSISRGLFKSTNTCTAPFANCVNQDNFNDLWKAFEKNSTGMGQSIYPFRNSERLLQRFKSIKGGTFSTPLNNLFTTDEALQLYGNSNYLSSGYMTWVPYGIKLVPSSSSCPLKIKPRANNGSYKSDQRFSNHYYYVDKNSLSGVTSINLTTSFATGTSGLDIDMLIFNEGYHYNEDCSSAGCSKTTSSDVVVSNRSSATSKNIPLSGLTAGTNYLLNIRAYTPGSVSSSTEYIYTMTDQLGGYLCPSTSY